MIWQVAAARIFLALFLGFFCLPGAAARDLLDAGTASPPAKTKPLVYNQRLLNERMLGWREIDNIPYTSGFVNPSQTLDLLLPSHGRKQALPLVVYIHGGGWYEGDKKLCPARVLLNFGYAVASLNYRLTDQAQFPAQIDDCKSAIGWLHEHAGKYGIDPERIGVWGLSAGGHLAALLGTTSGITLSGTANPDYAVQAVVDWFGPSDFTALVDTAKLSPIAEKALNGLFGGMPSEHKQAAIEASPVTYVRASLPPFLIMHGDQDNVVPLSQSAELYGCLKRQGALATLVVVPGAGHEMFGVDYIRQVIDFFDTHLKLPVAARAKVESSSKAMGPVLFHR